MSCSDWLPREAVEISPVPSPGLLFGLEREERKGGATRIVRGASAATPLILVKR